MAAETTPRWADQRRFLAELALQDLRSTDEVQPTMIAFADDDPLLVATLRPFPSGAHHDPIIELGTLCALLGANRLAVSFGGRAWSMADPIPPVVPDVADLRQRVVLVHDVDASTPTTTSTTTLWPIRSQGASASLGEVLQRTDGVGWVPDALAVLAAHHADPPDADAAIAVIRCEQLGHLLAWADAGLHRLARARAAASPGEAATGPAGMRGW